MAVADNRYSRFVAAARIVLPLLALGLLSTLFLLARQIDPSRAIPHAQVDVESLAREARIGAPTYTGVTEDGTAVELAAEAARPDPAQPGRMTAENLAGRFESSDGSSFTARAGAGAVDGPAQQASFGGGVDIETSSGYRVRTEGLELRLDLTEARSVGAVVAEGPPGTIEAGAMEISRNPLDDGAYLLVFSDRVKLVYDPGR